ncbi:MAG: hypothetical protein U5L96_06580 [Owenweeksia sp.]|nr:hypothetical protein [Owenweeksia sp.]
MASYLIFIQHSEAMIWSMVAGIMLAGFTAVEILVLDPEHPGVSLMDVFFLILGTVIFVLALVLYINPDYSS